MLESFTLETFRPVVGEEFRVGLPDRALSLVLGEATALPPRPHGRQPFTLLFRQADGPSMEQGTYPLDHPALGAFDLFLVPLGPDAEGMRYEAVFG